MASHNPTKPTAVLDKPLETGSIDVNQPINGTDSETILVIIANT